MEPRIIPHITGISDDDDDLQRIKPHRSRGLQIEDIENRSGNYLLSFGMPGSGKTTFQWFLMNYILNAGHFETRIGVPDTNDGSDWQGREIINSWKERWIKGWLPEPTPATEENISEIECTITPLSGRKVPLNFKFLEVAGELLRMAMPVGGNPPSLPPVIKAYLENRKMRFVFFVMINPNDERSDNLVGSFITYMDKVFPNLRHRMSLGVIVTREEDALRRLRDYGSRQDFNEFNAEALERFVSDFCPETHQILESWPDQKATLLTPLNIGRLEEIETSSGGSRVVLTNPDYVHIEQILGWIYEQFNGFPMGETFWQRMARTLTFR